MSDSAGLRSDPKSSIRQRIMSHVIWPLGLVWLLGTLLAAGIANHFVQQAFDRSLLDDAYLVASHVRLRSGQGPELEINMSAAEINGLLFDQSESVAFAVFRADGSFLAGHPGLRTTVAAPDGTSTFAFDNVVFQGRNMRGVVLRQSKPEVFSVIVAQTSTSRGRLLQNLLIYSVVPQVLLLFAWRGSGQDRLEYQLQPSPAGEIVFFFSPGRTRDLREHHKVFVLRADVAWSVR